LSNGLADGCFTDFALSEKSIRRGDRQESSPQDTESRAQETPAWSQQRVYLEACSGDRVAVEGRERLL
jgi:hypothetical protein